MPVKRIFLHIGTHKTGTTSFQSLLVDHAAHLRAHGLVPYIERRYGGEEANCFRMVHDILRRSAITGSRYQGHVAPPGIIPLVRTAHHIRRFLRDSGDADVVFSAEAFSFLRSPSEWARLRLVLGLTGMGIRIIPILALRNAADWRASWTDQIAKNPALAPDMAKPDFPLLADWWFDRAAIIRFWSRSGHLRIIDYDRAMTENGDILPALLAAMDVPHVPGMDYRANRRSPAG